MLRIVFASDSHLNKHYARMTPDQLAARRGQIRGAWQQTVDFALAERAEVYIHGGDLFDGPNPRTSELIWTTEQFQRLADAGVRSFLIGGNHDIPKSRLAGATPQRLFETARMAQVFTDPTAVTWWSGEVGGVRLAIGGLPPDPRLPRDADPLAVLTAPIQPPEADLVILVTHFAIEGTLHPQADEPVIRKSSVAALSGVVDYLLVGHIHVMRDHDVGGVKVISPGPTERLSFGEIDLRCGFAVLTVEGHRPCRVKSRHIHLDPQPMRRETVRATNVPAEAPTNYLAERVRAWSAPDQILQVRIEGPLPRETYQALRFLEVWQLGQDLNFYFDLDRHLLSIQADDPGELAFVGGDDRPSPRAEIARVADGFLRSAETDDERALVEAARALVLEQYGVGEMEEESENLNSAPPPSAVLGEGVGGRGPATRAVLDMPDQPDGMPAMEPTAE